MGWKDWPSWVKGGIIGLFLLILIIFVFFVSSVLHDPSLIYPTIDPWFGVAVFLILFFGGISFFLIGALIGWIIGKIKSKKENQSNQ